MQLKQTVNQDMIDDFFLDFNESYEKSEHILLHLEAKPDDLDLLNDLFRYIHTIKGNLFYVGLEPLTPILQSMEDILEELRKGRLHYNDLLSDAVLLSLDATRELVNHHLFDKPCSIDDARFDNICKTISDISYQHSDIERSNAIQRAIIALDPKTAPIQELDTTPFWQDDRSIDDSFNSVLAQCWGVEVSADLNFLTQLIDPIEKRAPYWKGRSRRLALLTLRMNQEAGTPANPTQLLAAVYAHDIGMAFLPFSLINSDDAFDENQREIMRGHVDTGYDLLTRMGCWEEAATIVLQHHESYDGSGYPSGLDDQAISAGAKILSIAGTFDACVNGRPHHSAVKRPFVRALLEVNRFSQTQFDPKLVETFNEVARKHMVNKIP